MTNPIDIKAARQARRKIIPFPLAKRERHDEIFNMRAINTIRDMEQQTGNLLLPSVLEGFISQMQEKLRDISQHIAQENAQQSVRIANAIRSMSANIGAEKVRLISAGIEAQCKDGEFTHANKALTSLTQASEEFVEQFNIEFIANSSDQI